MPRSNEVEQLETRLLLDGIAERYGYDLRQYQEAFIRKRIQSEVQIRRLPSVSRFAERILHDEKYFQQFLGKLSPRAPELFADTAYFEAVRTKVLPLLRTYPSVRIWQLGANVEEIYSLIILLEEHRLYDRTKLYATDISTQSIEAAKAGAISQSAVKLSEKGYKRAGGEESFHSYFRKHHGTARVCRRLKRNLLFFHYNPSTDSSPNEFHFVVCRGLLDEFGPELRLRVLDLIYASLRPLGLVAIEPHAPIAEMLRPRFEPVDGACGLFRRTS